MSFATISFEEFTNSAKSFAAISKKISDGWSLNEEPDDYKTFLKKCSFIYFNEVLLKAEYIVFYNISYGVPSFSFNIWNASGVLLSLDEVRKMSILQINQKDFYSVITQQEHPIFNRPYFIMHPCHTEDLIKVFKDKSKNIIVTFLGLIQPLLRLDLPLHYGLENNY